LNVRGYAIKHREEKEINGVQKERVGGSETDIAQLGKRLRAEVDITEDIDKVVTVRNRGRSI